MKWFKLVTSLLVLAVIGLFFYQNIPAFQTPVEFNYDLYIREPMQWKLMLYVLLIFAAVLGFLLGMLVMLKPYFNVRRMLAQERQQAAAAAATEAAACPPQEGQGPTQDAKVQQ